MMRSKVADQVSSGTRSHGCDRSTNRRSNCWPPLYDGSGSEISIRDGGDPLSLQENIYFLIMNLTILLSRLSRWQMWDSTEAVHRALVTPRTGNTGALHLMNTRLGENRESRGKLSSLLDQDFLPCIQTQPRVHSLTEEHEVWESHQSATGNPRVRSVVEGPVLVT